MRRFTRALACIGLATLLLAGCSCPQFYNPSDCPPPLPDCPDIPRPIRVALVLGGGGARGMAHVGVLEELEKANIKIDLIVGCSAGSIAGALYADNPDAACLKDTLLTLNTSYLIDFNIWKARYGLCQGATLRKFLRNNLCATNFNELKIPFFLVATDLYSSELVPIGGGPIVPAVEASCAIPLVFVPVNLYGRMLVDGSVIDPVPVRIARYLGADVIVAVDLRELLPEHKPTNLFAIAGRSADIALLWQSESCLRGADVIMRPKIGDVGTFAKNCNEQIYEAGREAGREAVPKILACLAKKQQEGFTMSEPEHDEQFDVID